MRLEALHDFELNLLDFGQSLPLPIDQMVELLMQVANLKLSLQIDAIVVLGPQSRRDG
jgi:hypothetical protein